MPQGVFTSQGNNLIGKTDGSSGWVGSDLTGTIASRSTPCWHRWATTAARPRPWPCCPAARPSTPASDAHIPRRHHRPARPAPRRQRHRRHRRLREPGLHPHASSPAAPRRRSTIGTAFANPLAVTVTANNPIEPVDGGVVSFIANRACHWCLGDLRGPLGRHRQRLRPPSPPRPTTSTAATPSSRPPSGSSRRSFRSDQHRPVFAQLVVNTTSDRSPRGRAS